MVIRGLFNVFPPNPRITLRFHLTGKTKWHSSLVTCLSKHSIWNPKSSSESAQWLKKFDTTWEISGRDCRLLICSIPICSLTSFLSPFVASHRNAKNWREFNDKALFLCEQIFCLRFIENHRGDCIMDLWSYWDSDWKIYRKLYPTRYLFLWISICVCWALKLLLTTKVEYLTYFL